LHKKAFGRIKAPRQWWSKQGNPEFVWARRVALRAMPPDQRVLDDARPIRPRAG
jgi:hypothetical protein